MEKKINGVKQIGIVVSDLDKAIEHWQALGTGEFRRFFFSSSRNPSVKVFKNGKKDTVEVSMAAADFNGMQIELLQPLDDHSIYADFLRESGEGIHHVCFDTGDMTFEEVCARMEKVYGAPIFNGIGAMTFFAYYDCRGVLGTFAEVSVDRPKE